MAFKEKEKGLSYIAQYQKENYDRVTVMTAKGNKEKWKAAAKIKGIALSKFVEDCVTKELEKMKK